MQELSFSSITTDALSLPWLQEKGITAAVLRLDKIHPLVSGNKIFKLRYYLEEATKLGKTRIVTFGGAWSNHILATAAAAKLAGFHCTGIIRGEAAAVLSPTLTAAKQLEMELVFLDRTAFNQQKRTEIEMDENSYVISEGGYGIKGAEGAATILSHTDAPAFTHICCAAGTGTMTAGLSIAASAIQEVISISALKNNMQLEEDILSLTGSIPKKPTLIHDYHFGGFAKHKPELLSFMNEWYRQTAIPSDFVYTGKLFFGINDLADKNFFAPGSNLLLIHSGGLQGNTSLNKGTLIF